MPVIGRGKIRELVVAYLQSTIFGIAGLWDDFTSARTKQQQF
jgi:hypothetical protein